MNQPFNFPDGRVANNTAELLELCEQYPDDATSFLVRQDLEKWLAYIGSYEAAECATNARQVDTGDRQKLEQFLNKCHSLTAQQSVPEAAPETNIKDNMTAPEAGEPIMEVPQPKTPATTTTIDSTELKAPDSQPTSKAPKQDVPSTGSTAKTSDYLEKPSFFQVVAKFIVKILYRDKA